MNPVRNPNVKNELGAAETLQWSNPFNTPLINGNAHISYF